MSEYLKGTTTVSYSLAHNVFAATRRAGKAKHKISKNHIIMNEEKNINEPPNPAFLVGAVMPSCLRLSLKTEWFEMTSPQGKTEDYRELTPYWYSILCLYDGKKRSKKFCVY